MATGVQVAFDAASPTRLARFWAEALGYQLDPPPDGYDSWEAFLIDRGVPKEEWDSVSALVDPDGVRPRLYFQRVPEPKAVKNRLHLDLNVANPRMPMEERQSLVHAEVERLIGLGATKLYDLTERGGYHVTMADPEGNEFCVH